MRGRRSRLLDGLRRFRDCEDGSSTVEFAIVIPAFLMILMSTVELGLINIRHSQLERALDETVRTLRLSTGANLTHNQIRDEICTRSGFIEDCTTSLRLELVQMDPYNWTALPAAADCVDRVENVQPVRSFRNGLSNELMVIRACMKFNPVFPTWGLGGSIEKDADGRISLFAASAFVQEPR